MKEDTTVAEPDAMKQSSTFFMQARIRNARRNVKKHKWAQVVAKEVVRQADVWVRKSDDELWALPYGADVYRAIDVSCKLGCPTCGEKIYEGRRTYYPWQFDPERHPWKLQCPGCGELFPKNDFAAFYRSGFGEDGLFHHDQADKSLLFNTEHPDPTDPKHEWAVDDARGWEGQWWIGYYAMTFWLQRIVPAVESLSKAYTLTDDATYAHKCAVLLDRLADIYPMYDGDTQHMNVIWKRFAGGYIGATYFDLAFLRIASLAYDRIFTGIRNDKALLAFLSAKAQRHRTDNPKRTFADVRRNIERRIILELIGHPGKILSNGTRTACVVAIAKMVLGGSNAKAELLAVDLPQIADKRHYHDDGSSGERSTSYDFGHITSAGCEFLSCLYDFDKSFAHEVLAAYPNFHKAFYFHINLRCLGRYVPQVGDSGAAGCPLPAFYHEAYAKLFDLTGDPLLAQYMALAKGGRLAQVHTGLYAKNADGVQNKIRAALEKHGRFAPGSVHYPDYRLAIFRGGRGPSRRAMWLKYTSEGGTSSHAHCDGMNLGLFAKGLNLVPEHGYPEYCGGWPPRVEWTSHARSHVTAIIDGENQQRAAAQLKLLSVGESFQLFQADGPTMYEQATRYERTCALVDISARDCYVVDIFRVDGGKEHLYDFHGAEGAVTSDVLETSGSRTEFPGDRYRDYWTNERLKKHEPTPHYLYGGGVTRKPEPGWWLDYAVEDTYGLRRTGADVHLRISHFTPADQVVVAKGDPPPSTGGIKTMQYLLVRRKKKGRKPLSSTFVSVIEPYENERVVQASRRLPLTREGAEDVVLSIDLPGGRRDVVVLLDAKKRGALKADLDGMPLSLHGSALWVRLGRRHVQKAVLINGRSFRVGDLRVTLPKVTDRLELQHTVRSGKLTVAGKDAASARVQGAGR